MPLKRLNVGAQDEANERKEPIASVKKYGRGFLAPPMTIIFKRPRERTLPSKRSPSLHKGFSQPQFRSSLA